MSLKARPVAPANFSRDLSTPCRGVAATFVVLAILGFALCAWALVDASALRAEAEANEALAARISRDIAPARKAAADAPALPVFSALATRVTALNALDHGGTPAAGGLFDALEEVLPNDAVLTNLDYDRNKGRADLVAVSAQSAELTRLFDVLDGHVLFAKVRLLDKKQVAAAGATHTQVNLILDIARDGAVAKAAEVRP